ncbi:MAG: hypothetical protein KIT65_15875 [Xanthobacteraceae bacterium]|nr:hypothetical protein [Xanthobacteraceae bacterium]
MDGVVILVDNKIRDLNAAALIAHHIRSAGVECHLEPLEAYRAVLSAYKPAMIVFNHLTASHLATFSNRMREIGVLSAVMPNEGISYGIDDMDYNAGRYHRNAHIDYYFCWNKHHGDALKRQGFGDHTQIEVVGVPRFDFYFKPWSTIVRSGRAARKANEPPRILVCTNFIFAQYRGLPKSETDKVFAPWVGKVKVYDDYMNAIDVHWRSRNKVPQYLLALIEDGGFEVTLRPHPAEEKQFYLDWLKTLPPEQRSRVYYNATSSITSLILDCDLEISCETCLTALESWIIQKPTVELNFEGHSLFKNELHARNNVPCNDPTALAAVVRQQLTSVSPELRQKQKRHLEEWCATPSGDSAARLANVVVKAVKEKHPTDWSKLSVADHRRGLKLKFLRSAKPTILIRS